MSVRCMSQLSQKSVNYDEAKKKDKKICVYYCMEKLNRVGWNMFLFC